MTTAERLARKFHDTYESLAPSFGYETREDTKQFDPESSNGRLMIAVCERLIGTECLFPLEIQESLARLRLEVDASVVEDIKQAIRDVWQLKSAL